MRKGKIRRSHSLQSPPFGGGVHEESRMSLRDPFKLALARKHLLDKTVCRSCGVTNPPKATKCRKCRSKNLRPKRMKGRVG